MSGRCRELRWSVDLAWASCNTMKAIGCTIEGVDDRVGIGEFRADNLPKAGFAGGMWWEDAIGAKTRGNVSAGFD